jgi:hypothetical protein
MIPTELIIAQLKQDIALRGLGTVAEETGYSKASLSLLCSGKYTARPGKILQKLHQHYGSALVECPLHQVHISRTQCQETAHTAVNAGRMSGNPVQSRRYARCRICPQNPHTSQGGDHGPCNHPRRSLRAGNADSRAGLRSRMEKQQEETPMKRKRATPRSTHQAIKKAKDSDLENSLIAQENLKLSEAQHLREKAQRYYDQAAMIEDEVQAARLSRKNK